MPVEVYDVKLFNLIIINLNPVAYLLTLTYSYLAVSNSIRYSIG